MTTSHETLVAIASALSPGEMVTLQQASGILDRVYTSIRQAAMEPTETAADAEQLLHAATQTMKAVTLVECIRMKAEGR